MFEFLARWFGRSARSKSFTAEEWAAWNESKQRALCAALGTMHDTVRHSLIPFEFGGRVDLYVFPHAAQGTAVATMELIQPNGSGPKPSRIGTYELVAFTSLDGSDDASPQFEAFADGSITLFTVLARYASQAVLAPGETCTVPMEDDSERHVIFDTLRGSAQFSIEGKRHGLLVCIELHESEMKYARQQGSEALLRKLRAAGIHPHSDLARPAVA